MTEPLVDTFGRVHRDLRVSLTDRCNLRCAYCMPNDFADWLPGPELLTTDELMLVLDVATSLGIDGVRLTGGEPLLRADVVDVVRRINELPKPPEISVTDERPQARDAGAAAARRRPAPGQRQPRHARPRAVQGAHLPRPATTTCSPASGRRRPPGSRR